VINFPKYGCINVHGSLLPEYRGAAPMQRAIIDGKAETGVTIMYMEKGLDTGDMLLVEKCKIDDSDNFEDIHDRLSEIGAKALVKVVDILRRGDAVRVPQDNALATYAAKIEKSDCAIDFSKSAREVHNLIRGLSPIPLSFTRTPDGKLLKILETKIFDEEKVLGEAGEVIGADDNIRVACGKGAVSLVRVLPEGKGRMSAADFVRGRKIKVGDILLSSANNK
jgi:methionyl-tRNA formyltransferase